MIFQIIIAKLKEAISSLKYVLLFGLKNMLRECLYYSILYFFFKVPPLRAIGIEINSACNRRCPWCPNHEYKREVAFLDEEIFYKIINDLKDIKFKGKLTFNLYNEPLLDKRLIKFIKYVRKTIPSTFIYLNTNGDFLDLNLWKEFRKAGLDFAKISQYDGKINENIKKILNKINPEEKKHFYAYIFNTKEINNRAGLVKLKKGESLPLKKFCNRPFYQLNINYKGKAVLCCNDYFGSVEIGDVSKESMKNIWKSDIFKYYRRKLLKKDRANLKLCNKCDLIK